MINEKNKYLPLIFSINLESSFLLLAIIKTPIVIITIAKILLNNFSSISIAIKAPITAPKLALIPK